MAKSGESNSASPRIDIVTGKGCLFKNDDNLRAKPILTDLTITSPCGNTFDYSARQSGYVIRGEIRQDSQGLIRASAQAKVDECPPL